LGGSKQPNPGRKKLAKLGAGSMDNYVPNACSSLVAKPPVGEENIQESKINKWDGYPPVGKR